MTSARQITPVERRFVLMIDQLVVFVALHWLLLVVLALVIYAGLPIFAPVLMHYGVTGPADAIYRVYSLTCHQLSYRSFFLFGSQPAYNIDQLHALVPSAADEGMLSLYWRDYLGNPDLGFKMAWCERDAAIYLAMILASVIFAGLRRQLKPLNWRVYLLFVAPIAVDGLWQLVTSPTLLLPFLPVHESTPALRLLTGALFGLGSVWFIFPYIQVAMSDAHTDALAQYRRGKEHESALSKVNK
ncbi:MAG TPA: DUF2085 domain-containing protein [Anaerolineae bacterium]